jgi:hypothetical protein
LVKSFSEWEKSGSGWRLWDYAVDLEPLFYPIQLEIDKSIPVVDDARLPRPLLRLLNKNKQALNSASAGPRR